MIEIRGLGIVALDHRPEVRLDAVVDLVGRDAVERLPEPETTELSGVALPRFALHAFDASAPARLALIARQVRRHDH